MKNKLEKLKVAGLVLSVGTIAVLLGCQSGNTSGGDVTNTNEVATGSSGSLALSLVDGTKLTTGTFQGFRVKATDSSGKPISNIDITCDTEKGLSLVEPTSGVEHTEPDGMISGKVGCDFPGSYVMTCSLPAPSGVESSQTIVCQGQRPAGFTGWTGAGGGGLGGGSANNDTTSRVRISSVVFSDTGTLDALTSSIDITQGSCVVSGSTPTIEPFFDSQAKFSLVNNSPYLVKITGMSYKLADAYGTGATASSGTLSLTGSAAQAVDANGGTGDVSSLLFFQNGGSKYVYTGNALTSGFKNITFTLYGENELGETFKITTSTSLSFNNFNRCSS